ncbi:hypothetical protein Y032_0005g2667 [Ancylostoma ceylanicum]|uniref:Uncharacterized protein n=1 Tax=Ancylostoma ceylanicum TaxID=53326 RepID=A0A016VT33_9BILA|nr:hypothetical protein Y032_0005g2667 [Ancylostoma ceylanicum]
MNTLMDDLLESGVNKEGGKLFAGWVGLIGQAATLPVKPHRNRAKGYTIGQKDLQCPCQTTSPRTRRFG